MILNNNTNINIDYYTKKSNFLVFIRTKNLSQKVKNLVNPQYDLLASIYGIEDITENEGINVISGGLSKFQAFYEAQKKIPDLLCYDYYIFLDEDLIINNNIVLQLLQFSKNKSLQLAHPVLDSKSFTHWKDLITDGYSTKEYYNSSIVEVMCPIFSKSSLNKLLFTFNMSISTWGLDLVWPKILAEEIHLINSFQIGHHNKPDTKNGSFYRYLKQLGVNPYLERYKLQFRFKTFLPRKKNSLEEIIKTIKKTDEIKVHPLDCLKRREASLNLFLNHYSLIKLFRFRHNYCHANLFIDGFLLRKQLNLSNRYSFDFTSIADKFFQTIEQMNLRTLFIGGTIEEAELFKTKIKAKFTNCPIEIQNGYESNLIRLLEKKIKSNSIDVIVLGLGSPLQENIGFILYKRHKNANIKIFTCGGFISQVGRSKNIQYYPKYLRKYGRFIYRIIEQKGVLKRILFDYPKSIFLVYKYRK